MQTNQDQLRQLYALVNARASLREAEEAGLRAAAKQLRYNSPEWHLNNDEQCRVHGERCAFAYVQGSLEATLGLPLRISVKEVA
jgi:hypothetical protein